LCSCCGAKSAPREKRKLHTLYRLVPRDDGQGHRREIAREIPVCGACRDELQDGVPAADVPPVRSVHIPYKPEIGPPPQRHATRAKESYRGRS
jgi:hypothetical protein